MESLEPYTNSNAISTKAIHGRNRQVTINVSAEFEDEADNGIFETPKNQRL